MLLIAAGGLAPARAGVADGGERPYSVQLHVHGSFSEGLGSIDSHSHEAASLGLDVLWWSDHDFRISSYRHASTFGFEHEREPVDHNEPWVAREPREREGTKRLVAHEHAVLADGRREFVEDAYEGARCLRVVASADTAEFRRHLYSLAAYRGRYRRPVALGVTLHVAVFPEETGEDARPIIELRLSEHAPRLDVGFEPYIVRYVLVGGRGERAEPRRHGAVLEIPHPYTPGTWNTYALPVTRDVARGFPFIVGGDNSLSDIAFGLEVRRGARGAVRFDALRIEQAIAGPDAWGEQQRVIAAVGTEYPGLVELQGVELSYLSHHINEFSLAPELPDYDRLVAESGMLRGDPPTLDTTAFRAYAARRAIEMIHARGGLASYNHLFGAQEEHRYNPRRTKEEALAELLANRVFGADILEVGYRERGGHDLADHLWVWDELAKAGLFLVGTGVSDSHGGRWREQENNFVSWIHARSPGRADLLDGLRAGRVFFGDLVHFDGTLDLRSARGFRMGQIVVTDAAAADISIAIDGLADGDRAHVIESGRRVATYDVTGPSLRREHRLGLAAAAAQAVRVEIYAADGTAKVMSNPLSFVRAVPEGGLPPARGAFDIAGVRSVAVDGFTLTAVDVVEAPEGRVVRITGRGENGTLVLETGVEVRDVRLEGLAGTWTAAGDRLTLTPLAGTGSIVLAIRAAPSEPPARAGARSR